MKRDFFLIFVLMLLLASCGQNTQNTETTDHAMVKLMTVDPGHFHAALVQKIMYDHVSPDVHVYAPAGPDVEQHLERIASYNNRAEGPTRWNEITYTGPDFFEKMIEDKPGNVVVLSGNNRKKAEYITKSVEAGFNVLADKPMIISPNDFPALEVAFRVAGEKGLLLYDIMTERYEVTTILQKLLSRNEQIFGQLQTGSEEEPAVTKESVHHFSKIVSGAPLIRPAWFFDTDQQGEGIVDVTTHLVDLVQWECFPEQTLEKEDVNMVAARRWPTVISRQEFKDVTGFDDFPGFLQKDVKNGSLNVYSNGEMIYQLKGVWAKVSVEWRYRAPEGGGDTHYSIMRGSVCDLVIRQTEAENFQPTLYIENIKGVSVSDFSARLKEALTSFPYDDLEAENVDEKTLKVKIPDRYRVTHEEHFGQVTEKFLEYMDAGKLPDWEVPGMIAKYFTTTSALRKALQ